MKHCLNWFMSRLLICLLLIGVIKPFEKIVASEITSPESTELPGHETSSSESSEKKSEAELIGELELPEIPEEAKDKYSVDWIKTAKQLWETRKKNGKLTWSDFAINFLSALELSADQIKVFEGLEMRNISLGKLPKGFTRGTTFQGTVNFFGMDVEAKLVVVDPTSETWGEQWARQKVETEDELEKNAVAARAQENEAKVQIAAAKKELQQYGANIVKHAQDTENKARREREAERAKQPTAEQHEGPARSGYGPGPSVSRSPAPSSVSTEKLADETKEIIEKEKEKPTPMAQEPGTPKVGVSFSLGLPKQTKITQIFGNQMTEILKKQLDDITIPAGKIIVSNFFYSQASEDIFYAETTASEAKKKQMEKPEFEREYNRLEIVPIRKGVNFIAEVGLAGPLKLFERIQAAMAVINKKASFDEFNKGTVKTQPDALIVKAGDVILRGVISPNMTGSQFGVNVPIQIGVDLTKISKVPKSVTKVIQQISTEGFYAIISPLKIEMLAGAAVRFKLGWQQEPFIWNMQGAISPQEITPAVFTDSTIQITDWCALSNFGLSVNFNWELLPVAMAMGIPFTGIGLRGSIRIGKEKHMAPKKDSKGNIITDSKGNPIMEPTEHPIVCHITDENALDGQADESGKTTDGDTVVCVAAGAKVQADSSFGELVFEGVAQNLNITNMVEFFIQLVINQKKAAAGKAAQTLPIDEILGKTLKLPTVNFKQMRIYIVPVDAMLGGKEYRAGIAVDSDLQWGDFEGGIHGQFRLENNMIKGVTMNGHMKPIEQSWIKIAGIGTADVYGEKKEQINGPVLAITYNEYEFGVKVQGYLELPKLNVSQKVNFLMSGSSNVGEYAAPDKVLADFETKVASLFTSQFKVNLDMMDLGESEVSFRFEQDFANVVDNLMKELQQKALNKLNEVSAAAGQAQGLVDAFKQQLTGKTSSEINSINQQISDLDRQLNDLRQQCNKYPFYEQPFRDACLNIPVKETQRVSKIAYREALLKPQQKAIEGATAQLKTLVDTAAKLRSQQQFVQKGLELISSVVTDFSKAITTIDVRKAEGSIKGTDLQLGKLPMLKELEIVFNLSGQPSKTIKLENLQFDFKNPQDSLNEIAKKIKDAFWGDIQKNTGISLD